MRSWDSNGPSTWTSSADIVNVETCASSTALSLALRWSMKFGSSIPASKEECADWGEVLGWCRRYWDPRFVRWRSWWRWWVSWLWWHYEVRKSISGIAATVEMLRGIGVEKKLGRKLRVVVSILRPRRRSDRLFVWVQNRNSECLCVDFDVDVALVVWPLKDPVQFLAESAGVHSHLRLCMSRSFDGIFASAIWLQSSVDLSSVLSNEYWLAGRKAGLWGSGYREARDSSAYRMYRTCMAGWYLALHGPCIVVWHPHMLQWCDSRMILGHAENVVACSCWRQMKRKRLDCLAAFEEMRLRRAS